MSLTPAQRRETSDELHDNFRRAGATPASVEADLGLTPDELAVVLDLGDGVDPADSWLLRDYLGAKIREAGGTPRAYTTLTEDRRADADRWFGIGSKSQF